jgi:recombinational DNA repair ATPase RecF
VKLIAFQVERFRNILDSGVIPIDDSITCLVGKNESGKTNLLHALHLLKPAPVSREFDEHQYTRWLLRGDQRSGVFGKTSPIGVWFELTDQE